MRCAQEGRGDSRVSEGKNDHSGYGGGEEHDADDTEGELFQQDRLLGFYLLKLEQDNVGQQELHFQSVYGRWHSRRTYAIETSNTSDCS